LPSTTACGPRNSVAPLRLSPIVEPTPESDLSRPPHWTAIISVAFAGTLLIGGVSVLSHGTRSVTTGSRSSNPISRASKGSEQPMNQSGANVSILSTVTVGSGEVRISGMAAPGANVTVNGAPVGIHPDGTWSVTLSVGHGRTVLTVAAVSATGSSRSSSSITVNG